MRARDEAGRQVGSGTTCCVDYACTQECRGGGGVTGGYVGSSLEAVAASLSLAICCFPRGDTVPKEDPRLGNPSRFVPDDKVW
jgi:hypothetical protein